MPKKKNPSALQVASAAYARAARLGTPEEIAEARTALNEAKIRAWVGKTLAEAPSHIRAETKATLARLIAAQDGGARR